MNRAAPVLDWRPVAETLTAWEAEYASLENLVADLFAELERRRGELAQQAWALEQQRREAEARRADADCQREENRRLLELFEQQERRLTEALGLLEDVKHGLEETPVAAHASVESTEPRLASERGTPEVEALRQERDALAAEVQALRAAAPQWDRLAAEIERLGETVAGHVARTAPPAEPDLHVEHIVQLERERATLAAELQSLRATAPQGEQLAAELERLGAVWEAQWAAIASSCEAGAPRERIGQLEQERAALAAELQAVRAAATSWEYLAAEIQRMERAWEERLAQAVVPASTANDDRERLTALEQERAALIAELEQVRARGAELHDAQFAQQREHAEQHARLVDELHALRHAVQSQAVASEIAQSAAPSAPAASEVPPRAGEVAPAADAPAQAADPVISSVMAQFAQLQRDVAKRRKRK